MGQAKESGESSPQCAKPDLNAASWAECVRSRGRAVNYRFPVRCATKMPDAPGGPWFDFRPRGESPPRSRFVVRATGLRRHEDCAVGDSETGSGRVSRVATASLQPINRILITHRVRSSRSNGSARCVMGPAVTIFVTFLTHRIPLYIRENKILDNNTNNYIYIVL